MQDVTSLQESWNKKRILLGLVILTFLIGAGYYLLTNSPWGKNKTNFLEKVKGETIKNENSDQSKDLEPSPVLPATNWKSDLQQKLDSVKQQINNLNVRDLTSSSPQIKKVIEDLQSLQNLPKNQAKDTCYNICKSL